MSLINCKQISPNNNRKTESPQATYNFVADKVPNFEKHHSSLISKIAYIVASIVSLGIVPLVHLGISKIVPKIVLPALTIPEDNKKDAYLSKTEFIESPKNIKKCQPFLLKTHDGAELDGLNVFTTEKAKLDFQQNKGEGQKWVLCLNGNYQMYETSLWESSLYKQYDGANVLFFNYRGVGKSTGLLEKPEDLYTDAETCIQYLLSKGVKEEDIVINGHSLGGGIGAQVATLHDKISYINERSFSSLSNAAASMGSKIWKPLGWVARKLITSCNWEMDTLKVWDKIKGKKVIVYHKQDKILGYHDIGLYKALKEKIKIDRPALVYTQEFKGKLKERLVEKKKPPHIKLLKQYAERSYDAHNYSFFIDPKAKAITKFISRCFYQSSSHS